MNIKITQAHESDIEAVLSIARQTFINNYQHKNKPDNFKTYLDKAFSKAQLLKEIKHPESTYYLVWYEKKLIAYFKLNEGQAQTENQVNGLEVERIYIRQAHQGRGLGRQLLKFCLDKAKEKQKAYLWLGVWEKNEAAIAFYKKCGMVKFGEHIFQLGDDPQVDFLMKLDIQAA